MSGIDVIVVNSVSTLSTLFESKALNFSDRPHMYFACELVGWRELAALMNPGPAHTAQRKLITQAIGGKASIAAFQGMIDHHVLQFIRRVIAEPDQLYQHVRT
jgi:cytochrome P450